MRILLTITPFAIQITAPYVNPDLLKVKDRLQREGEDSFDLWDADEWEADEKQGKHHVHPHIQEMKRRLDEEAMGQEYADYQFAANLFGEEQQQQQAAAPRN